LGLVFIEYGTENLRVAPVFGSALDVSPRIGHSIHITVDDAPWRRLATAAVKR